MLIKHHYLVIQMVKESSLQEEKKSPFLFPGIPETPSKLLLPEIQSPSLTHMETWAVAAWSVELGHLERRYYD